MPSHLAQQHLHAVLNSTSSLEERAVVISWPKWHWREGFPCDGVTGVPAHVKAEQSQGFRKTAQKAGKRDPEGEMKVNLGQKVHF